MSALLQLPVLVLDCQSTGASPQHGHLLEIGWLATRADAPPENEPYSCVVRLPNGARVPPAIQRITGISDADLEHAEDPAAVWEALRRVSAARTLVIHFARFEHPFLRQLYAQHGEPPPAPDAPLPFDVLCTHEIARRLLPDLPRRGLRALAGYFGRSLGELKRSRGHVEATGFVWRNLVALLADAEGITDLEGLEAWLSKPVPRRSGVRAYPMPRSKRLAVPDRPGVYRLLNPGGDILYVGKATSLRRRVNSYFQKQSGISERALEMLSQARDIDVTVAETPLEAALLETDEIKRLAPPYNRALRAQGRAPCFAAADLEHHRDRPDRTHRFGPLGSPGIVRAFAAAARLLCDPARSAEAVQDANVALMGRRAGPPEPQCLADGLALVFADLGPRPSGRPITVATLLRWGHRIWPDRAVDDDADDGEPEEVVESNDEAETDEGWEPHKVAEVLTEVVLRTAHALRRARWLCRLSESTVMFSELGSVPTVRRVLRVGHGTVVERGNLPIGASLPVPVGWQRSWRARRSVFDIVTHDRMCVLTTELRRLIAAGVDVQVRFGPRVILGPDALRRTLAWI